MGSITIRNLEDSLKARLRQRAARHGWSMEQEVRQILRDTLASEAGIPRGVSFAQRIHQRFNGLEAESLLVPARQHARPLPDMDTP